jgi:hypothetical protein
LTIIIATRITIARAKGYPIPFKESFRFDVMSWIVIYTFLSLIDPSVGFGGHFGGQLRNDHVLNGEIALFLDLNVSPSAPPSLHFARGSSQLHFELTRSW